jgi:hypothetical protein
MCEVVPKQTLDAFLHRFDPYLRLKNSQKAKENEKNTRTSFRGEVMRQNRFAAKLWFTILLSLL